MGRHTRFITHPLRWNRTVQPRLFRESVGDLWPGVLAPSFSGTSLPATWVFCPNAVGSNPPILLRASGQTCGCLPKLGDLGLVVGIGAPEGLIGTEGVHKPNLPPRSNGSMSARKKSRKNPAVDAAVAETHPAQQSTSTSTLARPGNNANRFGAINHDLQG